MRICKAGFVGAALLALAGCDGGLGDVTRNAPEQIRLPDGMVVAGAEGWCVDTITSRARGDTAVVVLGSCAAIARNALAPRPNVDGLVTISVDGQTGASPTADELEGFFGTEAGRAALARDGNADSVEILGTLRQDDLLFLHASDDSAGAGTDTEIWRALFDLEGRFISISLYGLIDRPISEADGLATLSAQVERLRVANDSL